MKEKRIHLTHEEEQEILEVIHKGIAKKEIMKMYPKLRSTKYHSLKNNGKNAKKIYSHQVKNHIHTLLRREPSYTQLQLEENHKDLERKVRKMIKDHSPQFYHLLPQKEGNNEMRHLKKKIFYEIQRMVRDDREPLSPFKYDLVDQQDDDSEATQSGSEQVQIKKKGIKKSTKKSTKKNNKFLLFKAYVTESIFLFFADLHQSGILPHIVGPNKEFIKIYKLIIQIVRYQCKKTGFKHFNKIDRMKYKQSKMKSAIYRIAQFNYVEILWRFRGKIQFDKLQEADPASLIESYVFKFIQHFTEFDFRDEDQLRDLREIMEFQVKNLCSLKSMFLHLNPYEISTIRQISIFLSLYYRITNIKVEFLGCSNRVIQEQLDKQNGKLPKKNRRTVQYDDETDSEQYDNDDENNKQQDREQHQINYRYGYPQN